jgi:filamentous hemagglutinin family protein
VHVNPLFSPASASGRTRRSSFSLPRFVLAWLVAAPVAVLPPHVRAELPTGAQVMHGTVGLAQAGNAMTLTQASRNAIVNWQSFGIGAGDSLRLVQSGADAAMLARVTGNTPSALLGSLHADGKLFLINQKGILVGAGATIDTAGFVGSTLDVSDADFLRGTALVFKGDSDAGVVNLGTITAREGNVLLFAHSVKNAGRIAAPKGTAGLGAGTEVHLASPDSPSFTIKLNLGAAATKTGVDNSGVISAAQAQLEAAGGSIYELAVNQSGVIRATGVENKNGRVLLTAAGGTVGVSGNVSARNADGSGGEILVGGDYRGANAAVANAARTVVTSTAKLDASAAPVSASAEAKAGRVIVWADDATRFLGTIDAQGAGGGFAEVSGKHWLDFNPSAPITLGTAGHLLLDPDALVVSTAADSSTSTSGANPFVFGALTEPATLNVTTLQNQLALSNVTLDTSNSTGDITVSNAVTWSTNNTLRLQAGGSINLNASLTGGATSTLALYPGRNATPTTQGPPMLNNRATLAGGSTINVGTLTYGANAQSAPTGYTIDAPSSVAPLTLNGNISVNTLEIDLSGGAAGVTTNGSNNAIGAFRTTGTGTLSGAYVVDHQGGLDVTLNSSTAEGPYLQFITPGALTLKSGSSLNFATSGSVLLASTGGGFVNQAGSAVFGGNARFLVYSSSPGATTKNGLTGTEVFNHAYDLNDDFSADTLSRFLFSTASSLPFLTYTADNASRAYGATDPTFTATVTGVQLGITNDTTGSPAFSTTATQSSGVGSYTLSIARGTLTSSNYDFTFVPGTLNISGTASLTISANNASRTYGDANPAFSASYSGFVGGDNVSLVTGLQFSTTATQSSGVGSYAITPFGATASGYSIGFVPGTLTISPASLTLSASNTSRIYGDANPVFAVSYSGFVNGDTSAVISGLNATSTATPASSVGNYPISLSGASAANYTISYSPATLAVTPAPLAVKMDDQTRAYGDANPAFTYSVSGLKNGDTAAASVRVDGTGATASATAGIGSYGILGTASTLSPNYTVDATQRGSLTITSRALTITANNATRIYGDPNPAFSATFSGLVAGDTSSVVTSLNFIPAGGLLSNVGNYAITPTGTTSGNYTPVFVPGTLSITPATLTGTINNASRFYGDANPAFTFGNVVGFKNSDSLSTLTGVRSTFTTPATATSNVGSYPVTGSATSDNYVITLAPGTLAVTPAPLTVTVANANRIYGQANPAFSATGISGFKNADTSSVVSGLSLSTVATATSNAGAYAITGTATAANYTFNFVPGTLNIGRAGATITAGSGSRAFGDTLAFTTSYNGFLFEDDALARSNWVTTPDSAAATPGLHFTGFTQNLPAVGTALTQNYLITFVSGSLGVVPRSVDVTAPSVMATAGVLPASFTVTAPAALAVGPAYTVVARANATNASGVGVYAITPEIVPGAGVTRAQLDQYYTFKVVPGQLTLTPPTAEIDPSLFAPKTLTPLKTTTLSPETEKKLTTDLSTKITVIAPSDVAYDTKPMTRAEFAAYYATFDAVIPEMKSALAAAWAKLLDGAFVKGSAWNTMSTDGRSLLSAWMDGQDGAFPYDKLQMMLDVGHPGAAEVFAFMLPTFVDYTRSKDPAKMTAVDLKILGRLADLTEERRADVARVAEQKYNEMIAQNQKRVESMGMAGQLMLGEGDFQNIVDRATGDVLALKLTTGLVAGGATAGAIAASFAAVMAGAGSASILGGTGAALGGVTLGTLFSTSGLGVATGGASVATGVSAGMSTSGIAVAVAGAITIVIRSIQMSESIKNEKAYNDFVAGYKINEQITSIETLKGAAMNKDVMLSTLTLAAEFFKTP